MQANCAHCNEFTNVYVVTRRRRYVDYANSDGKMMQSEVASTRYECAKCQLPALKRSTATIDAMREPLKITARNAMRRVWKIKSYN